MRHKMNVGKLLWAAGQIGCRRRLLARKYPLPGRWKMSGNTFHLGGGFREFGIFIVGRDAVADKKQSAVAFFFVRARARARRAEHP